MLSDNKVHPQDPKEREPRSPVCLVDDRDVVSDDVKQCVKFLDENERLRAENERLRAENERLQGVMACERSHQEVYEDAMLKVKAVVMDLFNLTEDYDDDL